jgi:hypothetical protein
LVVVATMALANTLAAFFYVNTHLLCAEQMARTEGYIGALAFSRTGYPASGEFADAVVLKAFGTVPSDLSDL